MALHFWTCFRRNGELGGGTGGSAPPRFCNKQRSVLFIFRKCPFFLKEKVPSKHRDLSNLRGFLRPCLDMDLLQVSLAAKTREGINARKTCNTW